MRVESWCQGFMGSRKLEQKKALQENEKMEKQGWEIRVESDNKNGIHAMDLL